MPLTATWMELEFIILSEESTIAKKILKGKKTERGLN